MTSGSIFLGRRTAILRRAVLSLVGFVLASPAAAQNVYRFYESGAAQPMALAASEIAVKARPGASDDEVTGALRRHVPQATTLEKWDRHYLISVPPAYSVRSLTARSAPVLQEPVIVESSPVLYVIQEPYGPKGGAPPPGDEKLRRLASMRIVTNRAIASLGAATPTAAQIQQTTRALSAEPVGDEGWWLFTYDTPLDALDAAYWMTDTARLEATPVFERMLFPRLVPNDPFYPNQWHLNSPLFGINVEPAWDTRQGAGRNILFIDDGVQLNHPDLITNAYTVASGNHYDFNGDDNDPSPGQPDDNHGTAVAGLAVARGNNALGLTGVAFQSRLLAIRLLSGPVSDLDLQQAFTWKPALTDVSSNSWGPFDGVLVGPGPLATAGLQNAVTNGRGGRGVVFVFAGGNGRAVADESNYDGFANSRFVIGVGAVTDTGQQASYSESGANIALVAPSNGGARGLMTTDRIGAGGYDPSDYTSGFGGTSGSTPQVAGAAALLIEANPNLGYRDVKEILMRSASRTNLSGGDPFVANGAGFQFSHSFGAGRLNVANALTMAATWTNLPAQTSISSTQSNLNLIIPDNNPTGVTRFFEMTDLRVETVELTVNISHTWRGDLQFVITAPSGMQSTILRRPGDSNDNFPNWTFTSVRHWGERSAGTWSVRISDLAGADVGTLNSLTLRIWGTSTGGAGQVLGYTDVAEGANASTTIVRGNTLFVRGWAADTVGGAPVQSVTVFVDGVNVGTASLGSSRPDVAQAFNRADFTNSGWTFQMSTANLSLGNHTATASATGPSGTTALSGAKIFTITPPPAGQVLGYTDVAEGANASTTIVRGNTLFVRGWAADTVGGAPVQSVSVFVDGVNVGSAALGSARPDVAQAFNRPDFTNSGWTFQMSTSNLSLGNHTVTATATGPSGTASLTGSKIVTITQPAAGQVLGYTDVAEGANASTNIAQGATLFVRGWAADTVAGAPVQSVTVFIDGVSVGTAALGSARPDVAQAFSRPDFTNSGWTFQISTASFPLGNHTATAVAMGPSGIASLVGAKVFTVTAANQVLGYTDVAAGASGNTTIVRGATLFVRGWAADTLGGAPVQSVSVFVDGINFGTAVLGEARPDVAQAFNRADFTNSGWTFQMSTSALSLGNHTANATATGPSGSVNLVGVKNFTVTQ